MWEGWDKGWVGVGFVGGFEFIVGDVRVFFVLSFVLNCVFGKVILSCFIDI